MSPTRILAFVLLCGAPPTVVAQQPAFEFTQTDQGVLVSQGGAKVLFYQRAPKSFEGRFTRAHYVHPLYDLDGNELTEDFPADHRHHRGIFWAWHQLWVGDQRAGDPWVCQDFQWDVQAVDTQSHDDGTAELRAHVLWKSPLIADATGQPQPLVDEITQLRIHPAAGDARLIDVAFRLQAMVPGVRIGGSEDDKGYGGFCWRIALPDDLRFVSSTGAVTPRTTQVDAGPWLDCVGTFTANQATSGLAVLCHPTLPGHVQPWILRDRRSMQNAVWPGRHPVPLSQSDPLVFQYRMVVHRGDTRQANIAVQYDAYAKEQPQPFADVKPVR